MKFRRNAKVLSLILVVLITLLIAGCDNLTKDTSVTKQLSRQKCTIYIGSPIWIGSTCDSFKRQGRSTGCKF